MIKLGSLKKRLIKFSIIGVVIVAVMGALAFTVGTMRENAEMEKQSVESQLATLRADIAAREGRAKEATKYTQLYKEIKGGGENIVSSLDRDTGQVWIAKAANTLGLIGLKGNFTPVLPIEAAEFRRKTLEGLVSEVKLEFGALTDEQAIRFVDSIEKYFPGYVKIKNLTLKKTAEINDETLQKIGRGETPSLIEGVVEFQWIGVRELPPEPDPNAAPSADPNAAAAPASPVDPSIQVGGVPGVQ